MFTGLIEQAAEVKDFCQTSGGAVLSVACKFANEVHLGDSICVNGVCLTVIQNDGSKIISFEVSKESLSAANFGDIKKGVIVNLERAMKINSRFDGHIVSGHIDGTAIIKKILQDGFSYTFEFEAEKDITKYIVRKGSVAINGISLTVNRVDDTSFSVEIIPHTYEKTNLCTLKTGDKVNIETDILSRYIEKFLYLENNNKKEITMELLEQNGYL